MGFANEFPNAPKGNYLWPDADGKLLNGPADNAKSSCMGCHGTSGAKVRMVSGMKDFASYAEVKKTAGF